jgi:hypothetical protein
MHGRYAMWSSLVDVGCCDREDALFERKSLLAMLLVPPHIIGELLHRQRTSELDILESSRTLAASLCLVYGCSHSKAGYCHSSACEAPQGLHGATWKGFGRSID